MEGSMMGSGIYSQDVSYSEFDCDNEECGKYNESGYTATDDWGRYIIECEFCGATYAESSVSEDKDDYYADQDDDRDYYLD